MLLLFFSVLIIGLTSGVPIDGEKSPCIIGGRDAKPGEFPYQVSIQRRYCSQRFGHFCGGSVLTPAWILSAAHCLFSCASYYRVVAGIVELNGTNPERQEINVVNYIIHPEYDDTKFSNDIGLVQLQKPLKFNKFIKPIQLPKSGLEASGKAVGSGWGGINNWATKVPNHLQALDVPILSPSTCACHAKEYIEEVHICTGPLDKGMCRGDSGGPLAQNGQIVGIVSFGGYPCADGTPSYYTKVSNYIDFITKHIKK